MNREVIARGTTDLEQEAGKRMRLQKIGYAYTITGCALGLVGIGVELGNIGSVIGAGCFIADAAAFQCLSKRNMGMFNAIKEELNLRKGQLRFWDDNGLVRPMIQL